METLKTVGTACDEGCCVAVIDSNLRAPGRRGVDLGVFVRPMFQVLADVDPDLNPDDGFDADWANAMDVPAVEYTRDDRIFL